MSGVRSLNGGQRNTRNSVASGHEAKARERCRHGVKPAAKGILGKARPLSERPAPPPAASSRQGADTAQAGCVAVVDPDTTYRKAMAACLCARGFRVLEFSYADAHCIPALAEVQPDAALINADALRDEGDDFLKRLHAEAPRLQLAVVSKDDDERVEETLLAAGAADFFTRGRSAAVVIKRLMLLVEGARGVKVAGAAVGAEPKEEEIEVGSLTLRLASHRALWEGQELPLTVTEFRIVRLLATSGEDGASFRSIYDVVHGEGFSAGDGPDGFRTNVRSLVRRIRRKFLTVEPRFRAIENLPGHGYRWRKPRTGAAAPPAVERRAEPRRRIPATVEEWRVER